jgi:predicted nucleic acid-binding protein
VIVIDASALLETLLRTPTAAAVEERLFDVVHTLHAPHLIDIEVAQVLRCYAAGDYILD